MSTDMEYQHNFSLKHTGMYHRDERGRKARTALNVLQEVLGSRVGALRLLNVGASSGVMDSVFAEAFGHAVGIDIDVSAIEFARKTFMQPNLHFEVADGLNLPFADASFDVVVCSQVYEHVPDPVRLMAEIERVLRPGGLCYFAATNRFILVEPHYRLWLLSWLPPRLAHSYLRVTGKGERYYERMRSYPQLQSLVANFTVTDYTARILRDPVRYAFDYLVKPGSFAQHVSVLIAARLPWICPGYIWLLHKRK